MSERRILVINPNSNRTVTEGISAAVDEEREPGALAIDCVTIEGAPFGIESDEDVAAVKPMIIDRIAADVDRYDAFVIACYSDPALDLARERFAKPVAGIQESAVRLATTGARRFGVLALGPESIERHRAYVRGLGLQDFQAGERPIDVTVDEAANDPGTLEKIVETGRKLVDEDGAEIVILGCAGMARHRGAAQTALGVPVIDPAQAAITMIRKVAWQATEGIDDKQD